jgi:hypothetical protein
MPEHRIHHAIVFPPWNGVELILFVVLLVLFYCTQHNHKNENMSALLDALHVVEHELI